LSVSGVETDKDYPLGAVTRIPPAPGGRIQREDHDEGRRHDGRSATTAPTEADPDPRRRDLDRPRPSDAEHGTNPGRARPDLSAPRPRYGITFVGGADLAAEVDDDEVWQKAIARPLQLLRPIVADGLFTAYNDEPNWHKAHAILAPAFTQAAMRSYHDTMLAVVDEMSMVLAR